MATIVTPVAEARSGLSRTLRRFRADARAEPVVIGSHRRPEAVIVPYARYLEQSASVPLTVERVRELAPIIHRLAALSSLDDVRVYGSVARGEASTSSDLDLLVAPGEGATLFDLAQFERDVELLLGVPVSVQSIRSLDPVADATVLREAVAL